VGLKELRAYFAEAAAKAEIVDYEFVLFALRSRYAKQSRSEAPLRRVALRISD
jgi:hypothetical protein